MVIRKIICFHCGAKQELSVAQAKRAGWDLWSGGGCCKACRGDEPASDIVVEMAPLSVQKVFVLCSECGGVFGAHEYADGHRPGFHWLTTDENKRRLREERVPIPLCPGYRRSGEIVVEDKRL